MFITSLTYVIDSVHLFFVGLNVFDAVGPGETTVVASANFASLKFYVDSKLVIYSVFRDLLEEPSSRDLNFDSLV